ncbi:MAG: glycine cleavage system protein GcvH [candidate division WOR-3 bacterium]|nr:glycine cleavage system protein GcvH [candidate division WOR-3 bacterium]MCX7836467.1 glycine cleavage system protein GcvH [candidate division WOR-3 bacterium]MDW8114566.1 glycine cleavage system protein GcvH [candidate division WOR-3 bacterium]
MSLVLDNLYYTKTHEWIKVEGDIGIIGITDFAQKELQDIVYFGIDEGIIGKNLTAGEKFGYVEAVKTAADLYLPISGEVIEINKELINNPVIANQDPYGKGWILKIKIKDKEELKNLLNSEDYKKHIGE